MKKIILSLVIISLLYFGIKKNFVAGDRVFGLISAEDIGILSISPEREMINLIKLDKEVEVWFPEGRGWYKADRVKKIYEDGEGEEGIKKMFFYNLGIYPEKIIMIEDVDNWKNWSLWSALGPVNWIRFILGQGNWLYKTEVISKSLILEKEKLDEVLPRDMALSSIIDKEIKATVLNGSGENGLGSFVADRLNWQGVNVFGIENTTTKDNCEISTSQESNIEEYADFLGKMFNCSRLNLTILGPEELVVSLGKVYSTMIKYNNYVRAF